MGKTIRTGFAGAGFAAKFHYKSLQQLQAVGVETVGVFSKRKESREKFAAERNLKAYDTLHGLLDAVDVVHVCVPPAFHELVTVKALGRNVHAIVEKPFTGFFGPPAEMGTSKTGEARGSETGTVKDVDASDTEGGVAPHMLSDNTGNFKGNTFPKEEMRREALNSASRMIDAERKSKARIFYAENWVYAPVLQKEVEIIEKTKAQLLWIIAEESHSGSHSPVYGIWKYAGGGSIMGKGTHPLTAILYLKRVEGRARGGKPIRPVRVTARTHEITRLPGFEDCGFLRTEYSDVEDYSFMHVIFQDGTVADIFATEIVMGGVHNWLEVFANNHRTRCNINPVDGLETYNPVEEQYKDVYVVEKIGTKQGWSRPAADEDWMSGYLQELSHFYQCIRQDKACSTLSELGYDTVSVIYSAYISAERGGAEVAVPGGSGEIE